MRIIIALLLLFECTLSFAGNKPFVFKETGQLPSGTRYAIEVSEIPFKRTPDTRPDDGSLWGIDGGYPETIVRRFSLQLNDKDVWIPWKLYSDICHVRKVLVRESNGSVLIDIMGGDAAGSYAAQYKFKNQRLVERMVRVGEFPKQVWEKTVLYNELWKNPDM